MIKVYCDNTDCAFYVEPPDEISRCDNIEVSIDETGTCVSFEDKDEFQDELAEWMRKDGVSEEQIMKDVYGAEPVPYKVT